MSEIKEKKNEELSDEGKENELRKSERNILDPEEQIRQFGRGKMTLSTPIQDGQNTVTELTWDFLALTGAEYVDAMDRDTKATNNFRITNSQALNLFAAAAAKGKEGLDATDIRRGLGMMDAQKATQIATVFFSASNRVGNRHISNV